MRIAALACLPLLAFATGAWGAVETQLRFELATFNATAQYSTDHYNQAMFDHHNIASSRGPYHFAMGSDMHRADLEAKGNVLAVYYNTLTDLYSNSGHDPASAAATISSYVNDRFTDYGAAPAWVIMNEISPSLWTNDTATGQTYRAWLSDFVGRLDTQYHYKPIVFSPFSNPAYHASDWQALSEHAYIGVEHYLSGEEVRDHAFSVAWAQGRYQSSKTSYGNVGVPEDRIFITEEFQQTLSGTGWGRAGVSADDWERVIRVRDEAIYNADFAGFLDYAWGKNNMQVSDAELIRFIDAHMSMPVLQSEIVPEPQALALLLLGGVAVSARRRDPRRG